MLATILSDLSNLESVLGAFQPESFWSSPIFEKETWSRVMYGLKIGVPIGVALLLLYEVRARKLGDKLEEKTLRGIGLAVTAVAFFAYFDFFNPNVRYRDYYHRHEFFHYYLGSKYDNELSYTRLYECAGVAEIELGHRAAVEKREIRDLRVNLIKPWKETDVGKDNEFCKKHFRDPATGEMSPRWEDFKKDVAWFEEKMRGDYWQNGQKDHGYNPPPVWGMTGKIFGSFGPAGHDYFTLLSLIDPLMQLASVLFLGWAFGWRVMMVGAVFWGCNLPANFYWTGGAFLRQDWVFFMAAALALCRKRYFALAGAALTWASLLRVFPVILFAGWGIQVLFHLVRHRSFHPDHKRLLAGCAIAGAVLIPASMVVTKSNDPSLSMTARLIQPYKEFYEHIDVHKGTPLTNTMGLETMLAHDWKGRMRFTRNDNLDDPFQEWKQGRKDRHHNLRFVHYGTILLVGAWLAWALRRTKLLWVGLALSAPLVMMLTNPTCYYYSVFLVCAAAAASIPWTGALMVAVAGASQVIGDRTWYWIDDRYNAESWLFFAFSLLLLYAYSRPFSVDRLKAWWEKKPEPRAPKAPAPAAE